MAKEKLIRVQPTIAHDGSAEVMRGGEVGITLDAVPNYGNPIIFEVSKPPSHGTLSSPKALTDHSSSVIYHHDGTKAPMQDEFTFRAKTMGRAASAPSRVTVSIVPPAPLIAFTPDVIDFGEVILSESKTAKLKISNIGGSKASGRLVFPKGFVAVESDRFALDEGKSAEVEVGFSPMETRVYSGDVRILPSLNSTGCSIRGTGLTRMEVIKRGPAECAVINRSSNPIRVNFSGGYGWQMPPETLIPPKGEKVISFSQVETVEGEDQVPPSTNSSIVHISDGLSFADTELPTPRRFIPLTVQSVSPESLGTTPLGMPIPVLYRLQNRSDIPKTVRLTMVSQSGGGVGTQVQTFRPGEVKEISFNWTPSIPGNALLKLNVDEGTKTQHELQWWAQVNASRSSSGPTGATLPVEVPVSATNDETRKEDPVLIDANPVEAKRIPEIEQLGYRLKNPWFGKPTMILEWKESSVPPSRVTLDEMLLIPDENTETDKSTAPGPALPAVKLMAVPVINFKWIQKTDHGAISMPQLSSGWHLISLSLYQTDSSVPVASSQIQVHISPKQSWWGRWKIPIGLLSAVLLLLFLRAQRARSAS